MNGKSAILVALIFGGIGLVAYGAIMHSNAKKNVEQDVRLDNHAQRLDGLEKEIMRLAKQRGVTPQRMREIIRNDPDLFALLRGPQGPPGRDGICQSQNPDEPCYEQPVQAASSDKCPRGTKPDCVWENGRCRKICIKYKRRRRRPKPEPKPEPKAEAQPEPALKMEVINDTRFIWHEPEVIYHDPSPDHAQPETAEVEEGRGYRDYVLE
jgi:hypothetical protein